MAGGAGVEEPEPTQHGAVGTAGAMAVLLASVVGLSLLALAWTGGTGGDEQVADSSALAAEGGAPAGAAWVDDFGRAAAYLEASAAAEGEVGPVGWIAVAEQARRGEPVAQDRLDALTPEDFARSFEKLDGFEDTADFDLLYLMNLRLGYGDLLPVEVTDAIDQRILDFKYWYTDATPGVTDNRWYWSENHRIIFHTLELLAGETFPDGTFTVPDGDGQPMTGTDHTERATALIEEWLDEKAEYGFSEWHSDVYYQKDLTPLLTLVEFSADEQLAARAAAMLDVFLFDLAMHQVDGNVGVTHGRSYAKDKLRATDQDTFGALQVLFGLSEAEPSPGDAGATLLARAERYRAPAVLEAVATSPEPFTDDEHMGVAIDPHEPVTPDPQRDDGLSYTDPDMVPFWWERGALTPWQTVGLTIDTAEQYDLWDTELFGQFKAVKDVTGGDKDVARDLTSQFADIINIGLLSEVGTRTYRDDGVMLSSAIDFRPGQFGHQYHAWQATLGEEAIVFTTSPGNEPRQNDTWPDGDLYWNGGLQPRSQQQGPAAIHAYRPAYAPPGPGLLEAFDYLPLTHAYFPTEAFDEVVEASVANGDGATGSWTFGRAGDRFVGLWSMRPTEWRDHTDDGTPTGGLTEPFDLVAEGGADNVWVVEVGRAGEGSGEYEDFEAFQASLVGATPTVFQGQAIDDGLPGPFDVTYESPGAGTLRLDDPAGPDPGLRFDNPFVTAPVGATELDVRAGEHRLQLDLATGRRTST